MALSVFIENPMTNINLRGATLVTAGWQRIFFTHPLFLPICWYTITWKLALHLTAQTPLKAESIISLKRIIPLFCKIKIAAQKIDRLLLAGREVMKCLMVGIHEKFGDVHLILAQFYLQNFCYSRCRSKNPHRVYD